MQQDTATQNQTPDLGVSTPVEAGVSGPGPAGDPGLSPAPDAISGGLRAEIENWFQWIDMYPMVQSLLVLAVLVLIAFVAHVVVKRYVLRLAIFGMRQLPSWWAGVAIEQKLLHRLAPLVPTVILARGIAVVPHLPEVVVTVVERVAQATAVVLVAMAFGALLNAANTIYNRYPISQGRPIKGYLQVGKILAYGAAGIITLAALLGESPWIFLSGLGAMTAVIMLIFRDTLLSLVAGIQLVNNDLIRVGDWIEMPQFNADGDVIDISLNVVQVRNWDKTITAIPTHKFLENSFKNWRGMSETGGRRIKRALHIDMTTIRFLTPEEIERFGRFRLLRRYIAEKSGELREANGVHANGDRANGDRAIGDDPALLVNSRHLSNVGTFRAYIREYLRSHPLVHQDLTLLVRQLSPGPHGLPLELYLFTNDTRWAKYEDAQSDIFDHLLAVVGEFGLRVFQEPTGSDLAGLTRWGPQRDEPSPERQLA